jgi:hypothetical protein
LELELFGGNKLEMQSCLGEFVLLLIFGALWVGFGNIIGKL